MSKKQLLDVEAIKNTLNYYNYDVLHNSIRELLATIPADKSSPAYALWLMSQGYKVSGATWFNCVKGLEYIELRDGHIVWSDGSPLAVRLNKADGEYGIYQEPAPIDDEALKQKCVKFAAIWASDTQSMFTAAERERLKEIADGE